MQRFFQDGVLFIRNLPTHSVFLLLFAMLVPAVALAPFVTHRLFRLPVNEKRSQGAAAAYTTAIFLIGLVVSFSLLQAQTNLRTIEDMVSREAAVITAMDRVLLAYDTPDTLALRSDLLSYGRSMAEVEWPLLAGRGSSPDTDAKSHTLTQRIDALEPVARGQASLFVEFMKARSELSDLRANRLAMAGMGLSAVVWVALTLLCCLLIVLSGLMTPEADRLVHVVGLMTAVSVLISLILIVDGPFSGEFAVSPEPILRALARNAARG